MLSPRVRRPRRRRRTATLSKTLAASAKAAGRPFVGWREHVVLPDLSRVGIKAKIDTGARTSALHAFGLRVDDSGPVPVASFEVYPHQRSKVDAEAVSIPIASFREIRSSNGKVENRPVVVTTAVLGGLTWPIEITLTSRDSMGFRMLLGRNALRRRFNIDPSRSYIQSERTKRVPH